MPLPSFPPSTASELSSGLSPRVSGAEEGEGKYPACFLPLNAGLGLDFMLICLIGASPGLATPYWIASPPDSGLARYLCTWLKHTAQLQMFRLNFAVYFCMAEGYCWGVEWPGSVALLVLCSLTSRLVCISPLLRLQGTTMQSRGG
jgi:hypothetical protein